MKFHRNDPPRVYEVGTNRTIAISDIGDIHLAPNEQVTFVTDSGMRHDFTRKDWGFYATPSINGRLANEGFKTALVQNRSGRIYLMVVEPAKMAAFKDYCKVGEQTVLQWLDQHGVEKT